MLKKILIVDDDSITRKYIGFMLRAEGYEILTARDGLEALETIGRRGVDLVMTDLNMPHMDGADLIRHLRENAETAELPILMLTTEGDEESRDLGVSAGANEYLIKPIARDVLAAKVREWMERHGEEVPAPGGKKEC